MANSGSKSVTVTSWDTLKFSWEEKSQSIENNTTTISWKMELIAGTYGRFDASSVCDWSVVVNGTSYSGKVNVGIANNATKTLAMRMAARHSPTPSASISASSSVMTGWGPFPAQAVAHWTPSPEHLSLPASHGRNTRRMSATSVMRFLFT